MARRSQVSIILSLIIIAAMLVPNFYQSNEAQFNKSFLPNINSDYFSGNNSSSSGCGNNPNSSQVIAVANYSTSGYFEGYINAYCGLINYNATLSATILFTSNNSQAISRNYSWHVYNSHLSINRSINSGAGILSSINLSSGNYLFVVEFGYHDSNNNWYLLDTDSDYFTMNVSGAGGGGNNSPVPTVDILSPQNNSVINSSSNFGNSTFTDYVNVSYNVFNHTGLLIWTSFSTDVNHSITWYSYYWQSQTSNRIGYGNRTVCVSLQSTNVSDCINLEVIPQPAHVSIQGIQQLYNSQGNSSSTSGVEIWWNSNHSLSYTVRVNGQISNYGTSGNYQSSVYNVETIPISYFYFNYTNVVCVEVIGEGNSTASDCITIFLAAPVYRFEIISPSNSSIIYGNSINVEYTTENYSGLISWTYTGINGNQSTASSYAYSGQIRNMNLYLYTFGWIQICGNAHNNVSIGDCVIVYHPERTVQGGIVSVTTSSASGYTYFQAWGLNYSSGTVTVNGAVVDYVGTYFVPLNYSQNISNHTILESFYLGYGSSVVCLNLVGENGTVISDCNAVNRVIPPHTASILSPNNNASFVGNQLTLTILLSNSTNHYFTINGQQTNYANNSSSQYPVQLVTGYGWNTICLISEDYNNQYHSDCITVLMIDPNSDSDQDGVPDHSDQCPNTTLQSSVNSAGCSTSQLDSDQDGVMDDVDLCPSTILQSNVDSNGCSMSQRDSDGDGINDSLDLCSNTTANSVIDSDGCAQNQLDSDSDGVSNEIDICPHTLALSQVDNFGCASNQRDTDSDGIVDSFDRCANTPLGTVVDQTGCAYSSSSSGSGNSSSGGGSSGGGNTPSIGLVATTILVCFVATYTRKIKKS